jgi:hypothetical protein
MRADSRRLLIRFSLTLFACWVFTVAALFGLYFAMRAAFTWWK